MKPCWPRRRPTTTSLISANTRATTFYATTGTTGLPKGVYFSHQRLVLHPGGGDRPRQRGRAGGRCTATTLYMPITPMFHD